MDTVPQDTPQKQCTGCKQWKPATLEYFHAGKNYRYGVNSRCKECAAAAHGHRKSPRPCDNEGNIQCSKCKEWKPATTDFFYGIGSDSNLAGECIDCRKKYALQYNQSQPKKYRHLKPGATTKICSKCKIEKPLSDFWRVHSRNSYHSRCIACERNYAPPDVEQKPLFVLTKVCKQCNVEKSSEEFYPHKKKSWDGLAVICKECNSKRNKQYRQDHRERLLEKDLHRHALNTSPKRRDRILYRDPYRMKLTEIQTRERARRMGVLQIEKVDYPRIFDLAHFFCYICEGDILPNHKIAFDHVIPFARGGSHTEDNIKLTHDVCNGRKHTRLISEMTEFQRRGV